MNTLRRILMIASAAVAGTVGGALAARAANTYQHVLLISIDGMHAVDLANCISNSDPNKQCTNLAKLAKKAIIYPNALSSAPSDSFPGLLALVTGGTPKTTGVFYDNSYDRTLFAPGSNCQGPAGTNTVFDESIDVDPTSFTGGGTLGKPLTQIDPAKLPMAMVKGACARSIRTTSSR